MEYICKSDILVYVATHRETISLDEFYHLYSRGVEKRHIFLDENDRNRFIRLLFLCNGSKPVVYKTIQGLPLDEVDVGGPLVAIGAYCLMPNHFHILVKEITQGGTVRFMSKLLTSYSMYFNLKNERTGRLFESNFKSTHASDDNYLKYLFSYIHLNPAKLVMSNWRENLHVDKEMIYSFISKYEFSSIKDYLGEKREINRVINPNVFPGYFQTPKDWKDELMEWISLRDLEFQG